MDIYCMGDLNPIPWLLGVFSVFLTSSGQSCNFYKDSTVIFFTACFDVWRPVQCSHSGVHIVVLKDRRILQQINNVEFFLPQKSENGVKRIIFHPQYS